MPASKQTLLAMLLAASVASTFQMVSPADAAPEAVGSCIEGAGRGRLSSVPLTEYTVALVADTIEPTDPRVVNAKVTLLFRHMRAVYPWINAVDPDNPARIFVQCKERLDQGDEATLPNVSMEVADRIQAVDLIRHLTNPQNQASYKQATVPAWPAFLAFYKDSYVRVPPGPVNPDELVRRYFDHRLADPTFLVGFPYKVSLSSQVAIGRRVYPGTAAQQTSSAQLPGGQAQQPAPSPSAQPAQMAAQESKAGGPRGRGPQNLPQSLQNAANPASAPRPVNQTPVDVTIRFGADKELWQALLQRNPDLINTFDYCASRPEPAGAGAYKLKCSLRPDRKLPVRIAGFEELQIGPDDSRPLDDQLKVVGYKIPYPRTWARASTDFVSVPPGALRTVLGGHIRLSQDIAGCELDVRPTIEDIVSSSLKIPAEAPCKTYEVRFKRELPLAQDAAITAGCLPGSPISIPIRDHAATCWTSSAQTGIASLQARLLRGFAEVDLPAVDSDIDYTQLRTLLAPAWPYDPNLLEPGESRTYKPDSVRLVGASGSACEGQVGLQANGSYQLPTLAEMGCGDIPLKMTVRFRQDGNVQGAIPANTPGAPPALAFQDQYADTIDLASVQPGKRLSIDQLKARLPIRFSPDDAATFESKFGEAVENRQWPGVFVFKNGSCTGKNTPDFVRFKGPYPAGTFTWPIKAASYDSGEPPLTLCADAIVKEDTGGRYLTFELKGARAAGPRRAIVISESLNVINNGGSRAITAALEKFVDKITEAVNVGKAPLSPINVFLASNAGELKPLFNGEKAANEPQAVKALINQPRERTDQATPDFRLLRYTPELKNATGENFDHVIFVMDGLDISQENTDVLAGLTNRIRNADAVTLLITANNCSAWRQLNPNFGCYQLPPDVAGRGNILADVFSKLILPPQVQATNQPTEPALPLRPGVPPSTSVSPLPPPTRIGPGPGSKGK